MLLAISRLDDGTVVCEESPDKHTQQESPILVEILLMPDNTLEIICGKNRYGSTGTLRLPTRISSYPPPIKM